MLLTHPSKHLLLSDNKWHVIDTILLVLLRQHDYKWTQY